MFARLQKSLKNLKGGDINTTDLITLLVAVAVAFFAVKFGERLIALLQNIFTRRKIENFDGKKELTFFKMNGCGHCEKFAPEWAAAKQENTTGISMVEYETKDNGASELIEKYGIKGFPTLVLCGAGGGEKLDVYDGPRTKDGLLAYLKLNE